MSDNTSNSIPPGFENAPADVKRRYIERQRANAKKPPIASKSSHSSTFSTGFANLSLIFDIMFYLTIAGLGYLFFLSELPSVLIVLATITTAPTLLIYYTLGKLCHHASRS